VSPFFPAISDIRALCEHWVRRQREIQEEQEQRERREQVETARSRGELVDFADIRKRLADVAANTAMPVAPVRRFNPLITTREIPPAIPMTAEEIKARREKELEEINRYASEN